MLKPDARLWFSCFVRHRKSRLRGSPAVSKLGKSHNEATRATKNVFEGEWELEETRAEFLHSVKCHASHIDSSYCPYLHIAK